MYINLSFPLSVDTTPSIINIKTHYFLESLNRPELRKYSFWNLKWWRVNRPAQPFSPLNAEFKLFKFLQNQTSSWDEITSGWQNQSSQDKHRHLFTAARPWPTDHRIMFCCDKSSWSANMCFSYSVSSVQTCLELFFVIALTRALRSYQYFVLFHDVLMFCVSGRVVTRRNNNNLSQLWR